MKHPILLLASAAVITTATIVMTPDKSNLSVPFGSNEERIIRYLAKMDDNKQNPDWQNSRAVNRAKTQGALDYAKVRSIFEEQEIMSPAEFDATVSTLREHDIIHPKTFQITPKGTLTYRAIQAQYVIDRTPLPDTNATTTGDILPL